jgi:hypothetical protein
MRSSVGRYSLKRSFKALNSRNKFLVSKYILETVFCDYLQCVGWPNSYIGGGIFVKLTQKYSLVLASLKATLLLRGTMP